uniref:Uncharacterized protein n=1 Tax=Panagrellus redivivus TaxID=6233 RepID=A0A7E4UUH7_PANRE
MNFKLCFLVLLAIICTFASAATIPLDRIKGQGPGRGFGGPGNNGPGKNGSGNNGPGGPSRGGPTGSNRGGPNRG